MVSPQLDDDANKFKPFRRRQTEPVADTSASAASMAVDKSQDDLARGFMLEYPTDEVITRLLNRLINLHLTVESVKAKETDPAAQPAETILTFVKNGVSRLDRYLTSKTAVRRARWVAEAIEVCVKASETVRRVYAISVTSSDILAVPDGHRALLLGKAAVAMVSVINAVDCKVPLKYRNELVAYAYTSIKSVIDGFLSSACKGLGVFMLSNVVSALLSVRSSADRLDIDTVLLFSDSQQKPTEKTIEAAVRWLSETRRRYVFDGVEVSPDVIALDGDGEFMLEWVSVTTRRRLMIWVDATSARYLKAWGPNIHSEMDDGDVDQSFDDKGLVSWVCEQ